MIEKLNMIISKIYEIKSVMSSISGEYGNKLGEMENELDIMVDNINDIIKEIYYYD